MGKIGIHVTPGDWIPHVPDVLPTSLIGLARARLAEEAVEQPPAAGEPRRDRPVDRALAWLSYYSLVFVAFAIFLPGITMDAIAGAREAVLPGTMQQAAAIDWSLRGSAGF